MDADIGEKFSNRKTTQQSGSISLGCNYFRITYVITKMPLRQPELSVLGNALRRILPTVHGGNLHTKYVFLMNIYYVVNAVVVLNLSNGGFYTYEVGYPSVWSV